ncbi:tripartite motif-containing protein 2-like [Magallana gigas]|uniref:tripartite motif-containing protein 2-like n=1 Tax=Magallana gigas TaxID=29159 RepID=UPI0033404D9D
MALSKPDAPKTVSGLPVIAQHYLMCGTKDCEKNCQFYCNPCHRPMCEQCRDEHQKSSETKSHEVVPYKQRKIQLPVEKCKDHPNKDIDILCEDCQVLVCSKCATQNHQKHTLKDLETIYSEKFSLCLKNIKEIHQVFIPNSQDVQRDIKENAKDIKETMDNVRNMMKTETESLKCLLETVTSDNIEQVNKMEESLMESLQSQDKTYQDYISYLEDLAKKFNGYLSSTKLHDSPFIFSHSDQLKAKPIPETIKPVPPVFTAGRHSKEDVAKLLGRVTVPETKPENREIKPMETASTQYNMNSYSLYLVGFLLLLILFVSGLNIDDHTWKQIKENRKKSYMKPTLSLSSSVTKVREYTVQGVNHVHHISLNKSDSVWGSDLNGNFVQTDLLDNLLQKVQTSDNYIPEGYHTVTQDGDLIYTDKSNKVINRITQDKTLTEFIKTGDWKPLSIYSSHINGDILVLMRTYGEAKVTRYNKRGEEIQNIQKDNKGQDLYDYPYYITENINGDICTSDYNKGAVVVVNKSGQHRFSYTGQGSKFFPYGICTDLLGHILVSDAFTKSVYLLDQDSTTT